MDVLLSIGIMVAMSTVGEYVMHRWWMHRRGTYWFAAHAIEHHRDGANESHHMGLSWQRLLLVWTLIVPLGTMAWVAIGKQWWTLTVPWTVFLCWWFFSWGPVHRAIHGEDGWAWARILLPWYNWTRRHHLRHHERVKRNFGAMFPWSDFLFGTVFRRT